MEFSNGGNRMRECVLEQAATQLDLEYWKGQLGSDLAELNLPIDFPRVLGSKSQSKVYSFKITSSNLEDIERLSGQENISPFVILLTTLKILIFRYSNDQEIRIGSYSLEDPLEEMSLCQTFLNEHFSFLEALRLIQSSLKNSHEISLIPLFNTVNNEMRKTLSVNPFFQVMINRDIELTDKDINFPLEKDVLRHRSCWVDLTFRVIEIEKIGELRISILYDETLFEEQTIARLAGHFSQLLAGALEHPYCEIGKLSILTDQERDQLINEWNQSRVNYPRNLTVQQLFEEQVNLNPDGIALVYDQQLITYSELNQQANQIARYLKHCGIGHEDLVAICLEKSTEMMASFLGVLKAGGAYVPIDLSYPIDRIAYMLKDSKATFVITKELYANDLPLSDAKVICLDKESKLITSLLNTNVSCHSTPESLAYVMYTSGSTGKPKGVAIIQRGIVRLVKNIDYANVGPDETILNRAPISFDASVFDIYGALLNGGKLVILKQIKPSFTDLATAIVQNKVTTLGVTPSILNLLIEDYSEALVHLKQIISGGEQLPVWLCLKVLNKLPNCRLINAYGPTENSVNTTAYEVKDILPSTTSIPIGRPIANDSVYILDKHLQPVPIGVIGELYMSGDGISRGYLNKEELTNERFLANPFEQDLKSKLYKSGDFARYRSDGVIEYLGRVDNQVKIRGVRIELGEVESILGLCPGVREAAAGIVENINGVKDLVAYVIMIEGVEFNQQHLRQYAREAFPEHMIPTFFVEMEEFPVTPVGKLDRKKLPAPKVSANSYLKLPTNPIEEQLVKLWEELLEFRPIGITDNYFDLGGNSLIAMGMFAEIDKQFNKRLPASVIFQADTIEKLAKQITGEAGGKAVSLVPIQPHGSKTPLFCIHPGGGDVFVYNGFASYLGQDQPIYGLRFTEELNDPRLNMDYLSTKYLKEIREIQPIGPYNLLGYCFGGPIAFEMAQKLIKEGQQVALLGILSFSNPKYQAVEVKTEISYKNVIRRNLYQLFKMPLKKRVSFLIEKSKNAIKLFNTPPVSEPPTVGATLSKLIRVYEPKPFPGDLLVMRPTEDANYKDGHGWETSSGGEIYDYGIQTRHNTFLEEPYLKSVMACLKKHF